MPHNANHAAIKLANIKSVLRKSAADLLTTADLLQFIEGMAQRLPDVVPVSNVDQLNSELVALLDRQHHLQDALAALLAQISADKHGAAANTMLARFYAFMQAQPTTTDDEPETRQ